MLPMLPNKRNKPPPSPPIISPSTAERVRDERVKTPPHGDGDVFLDICGSVAGTNGNHLTFQICCVSLGVLWWWESTCVAEEEHVTPEIQRLCLCSMPACICCAVLR